MRRFLILYLALTFILGIFLGSTLTAWMTRTAPPMTIVADELFDVPVVRIDGIRDAALVGNVAGNVRVVANGHPVVLDGSGSFAVRDTAVLTNIITIKAPAGMHYVASKRGKKYYPIDSASARTIVPENRVYFPDRAAAEKAGFEKN